MPKQRPQRSGETAPPAAPALAAPDRRSKGARTRLLDAALGVIRAKGFAATSVDDLCAAAGVTKGAFFHHFESKEALAVAAAEHWSTTTGALFAGAPYQSIADPLQRLLAYIDFRKELIRGAPAEFTCFAGTLVQEAHASSDDIRDACWRAISDHAATLEETCGEAARLYGVPNGVEPASLALYTQATLQGAFILAKAKGDAKAAIDCVDHLRRYVELLFTCK